MRGWPRGLVLALALVVAGCGWQLRGAAGGGFEDVPVAIEGSVGNRVVDQVAESLRDLGGETVSSAAQARFVLQIDEADSRRRTVATDSRGFATEYELTYRIAFRLVPGGLAEPGQLEGARQTVQTSGAYPVNPDDLQAVEAEEEALRADLQADAIRLMLARVGRRL